MTNMSATSMCILQTMLNQRLNDAVALFLQEHPETPLPVAENACLDAKADVPATFAQVQSARAIADAVPDDAAEHFIRQMTADLRPFQANVELPASIRDALNPKGMM
ncbi:hypothetical protein ACFSDD_11200 [Salipiger marinus]|uniref:hypothetical protein n=1 Tax=Salipiger marinus TaxID=555512 RepID=UPI002B8393FB|nr:hypothetical protein [Salipiger manganoxidans]MEB3419938.1 hypothetical protein [Salipiger manganoxidans]